MVKSSGESFCFNFNLYVFRFPCGRSQNLISMLSGFLDVSSSPKTNCFYLRRHQDTPHILRKLPTHFFNIWCCFINRESLQFLFVDNFRNGGHRNIPTMGPQIGGTRFRLFQSCQNLLKFYMEQGPRGQTSTVVLNS